LNIQQTHIDRFVENLWKDTRLLQIVTSKDCTVFRRHADKQTSIQEEYTLLMHLTELISFNIPRILAHTPACISYEYIYGTRAFNLITDLKDLFDSNENHHYIDLGLQLMEMLRSNLSNFQNKTSQASSLKYITRKYPAEEKIHDLYELLGEVLSLENLDWAAINEDLQSITTVYNDASDKLFRDATPKNVILNIPVLHLNRFKNRGQRLQKVKEMVNSGELKDFLVNENLYHIDFSGCLFLCPEIDDWIALEHHEATHWLSEHLGRVLVEDDPVNLCTLFVRFSRFGGRKLAYKLLNHSGYQIRFGLDNESFYFSYLKRICEKLIEQEIISNKYLITLMDVLFEACTVIPAVDYLHTFRKDLSETPYYQDVYPN